MRRSDDHPIRKPTGATTVVTNNLLADDRRWRVTKVGLDVHFNAITYKHFESGCKGRFRQRMGVFTQHQWTSNILILTISNNSLTDSQNMRLVE